MAVSVYKTFTAGEILTAADLNSSFTQITSNGEDLGWPATKAKDFDGQELILDSDGDTSITADTDDQMDFKVGGTDIIRLAATGLITDIVSSTNTRLGVGAGDAIQSGATQNSAFGNDAGGAITTGDHNSLFGYEAGASITTASNVTAFGHQALKDNTSAVNTAFGGTALWKNVAGSNNAAFGYAAGQSQAGSGDDDNTWIGAFAGQNANGSSVGRNTGLGSQALTALTTGVTNTSGGYQSLNAITTTSSNTAFGSSAGAVFTDSYGAFFGAAAGVSATSAILTTAIGFGSLSSLTTGDYNTGLGGSCGDTLTTGGNNILLGYQADVSAAGAAGQFTLGVSVACDQDNQITIGNSSGTVKNEFDTDNAWTQASDLRKKNIIGESPLGLDFINDLQVINYTWKPQEEWPDEFQNGGEVDTDTVMTGLAAQRVKAAIDKHSPNIRFAGWSEDNDGQRISKEMFVFPLINAVNELTARIEALESA